MTFTPDTVTQATELVKQWIARDHVVGVHVKGQAASLVEAISLALRQRDDDLREKEEIPQLEQLIPIPQPIFTLISSEEMWKVSLTQGDRDYAFLLIRTQDGLLTIHPSTKRVDFVFKGSQPDTVLAVGRLLVAAARKMGAMDA